MQQRRDEVRRAWAHVRACDEGACRELVGAILEQCIADLRSAHGGPLEDAVRYLVEPAGELVRWHALAVGIDVAALRARAQQLLAERFGDEAAADLWRRVSILAGAGGRRRARRVA